MAQGNSIKEVKALMPKVKETFDKYKQQLKEGTVPITDLVFTKLLSKGSGGYNASRNTVQTSAIHQLEEEGKVMRGGQVLQFVITDYYRRMNSRKRSIPIELITDKTSYDKRRYVELLSQVCNSVTTPFGYSVEG
jgi:DNA polymerase elongation subunit (family B)